MVKNNWKLPEPPKGFDTPVAITYDDGETILDWTREPERDFASEYQELEGSGAIEWPFDDGVHPDDKLWVSIGFLPLS